METVTAHSALETKAFGQKIAETIIPGTLICLQGDLGAGKTTFAQGFLESMGAARPFVSPTFVIMKLYELSRATSTGVKRIYHADAYRVEEKDLCELGFAEWCADPEGVVLLEWPERIVDLLPEKRVDLTFRSLSENEREITVNSR